MNEQEMEQFRKMQEQNEKQQAAMMKEMGIDPNEFAATYDDPELAALDAELNKQGNDQLEDDDALLAQLDGGDNDDGAAAVAAQKEAQRQKLIQAKSKETAMKQEMKAQLQKALKFKQSGDKEQALAALKQKKSIEKMLKDLQLNYPELEDGTADAIIAQGPPTNPIKTITPAVALKSQVQEPADDVDDDGEEIDETDQIVLEDKFHDPDTMVSMAAIEHELKYLDIYKLKFKNNPDEKEFFDSKIESLNFAKQSIETNIQTGITTPASYLATLRTYVKKVQQQGNQAASKLGDSNEHVQRLNKRIKILNDEISEINQGLQQQQHEEQEEPQAQQTTNKDQAMEETSSEIVRDVSIVSGMDVDLSAKQQELVSIVKQRTGEYHDAVQYAMKELGDKQQATKLIEKAEALNVILKKLEKGKSMTKEEQDSCKSLTPEMVFGINEIQRLEKFQEAKKILSDEQAQLIAKIKEYSEAKKNAKSKKDQEMAEQAINDKMEKARGIKVQIQKILQLSNNKWQPPPIIGEVEDFKTQEKFNEDLEPDQIKIKLTNSERLKGLNASSLDFKMHINESNQTIAGKFNIKKQDEEEYIFTIQDHAKIIRVIGNKEINFDLKKKKFCGTTTIDSQKFKMSGFATKSVVERPVQLEGQPLKVQVTLYKALRSKEFERVAVMKTAVKECPKPFREADYVAPQPKPVPQQQPVQTQPVAAQQKPQNQPIAAQSSQASSAAPKTAVKKVALPEGMTATDAANPNNIDNLNCMSVLEKKVPEFKAQVDKAIAAGTRPNPQIRQLWMDSNKRMMQIQAACGSGQMTPEQYVELQKNQVKKDEIMIEYFKQTGEANKLAIVQQRIQLIQAELQEMQ